MISLLFSHVDGHMEYIFPTRYLVAFTSHDSGQVIVGSHPNVNSESPLLVNWEMEATCFSCIRSHLILLYTDIQYEQLVIWHQWMVQTIIFKFQPYITC